MSRLRGDVPKGEGDSYKSQHDALHGRTHATGAAVRHRMYCLAASGREGIMGVQVGVQIDSSGSSGLSETLHVLLIVDVTPLTALGPRLRIPPSPPKTPRPSRRKTSIHLNARLARNLTDSRPPEQSEGAAGSCWPTIGSDGARRRLTHSTCTSGLGTSRPCSRCRCCGASEWRRPMGRALACRRLRCSSQPKALSALAPARRPCARLRRRRR